ncbi:hypothetical protein F1B92_08590 [Campylobacter sp. FMV-PI01]|uniref:Uncharacterized protein n=1 Tax=Campylobacter portucalensis TaxID=2608384 RepID=A0A6L5WLF3_9BACT|nr:hypothetical protein [Campylobacter portucalensis]MSN97212.1 hypothetical protein [Campylobacter portucalensis]
MNKNKMSQTPKTDGEIPLLIIKDYNNKLNIKLCFMLACFIFIYRFFDINHQSVFTLRLESDAIILILLVIFAYLFKKNTTIEFFNDKIIFSDIFFSTTNNNHIELNKLNNDEIFITPYSIIFFSSVIENLSFGKNLSIFSHNTNSSIAKLASTFANYLFFIFLFPFTLLLKLAGAIKSIEFNFLRIDNLSIPLSELSENEYLKLNEYFKNNLNLEIKNIKKINLKGEQIC